jgi:hypothetical protein
MGIFKKERAIDIVAASGMLRVSISPKPSMSAMVIEALVVVFVGGMFLRTWASMTTWVRVFVVWGFASAISAWFYQLSGSETIEVDERKLTLTKHIFGWNRTREYAVSECHDLEWHEPQGEGDTCALQCKIGWRSVRFGEYISETEAIEILTALQVNLPDVADQLLSTHGSATQHFTTLKLN